jgi:hypothetical protein
MITKSCKANFRILSVQGNSNTDWGHRGRDRMLVVFTTTYAISAITTNIVSSKPVYLITIYKKLNITFTHIFAITMVTTIYRYKKSNITFTYTFCHHDGYNYIPAQEIKHNLYPHFLPSPWLQLCTRNETCI